MHIYIYIYVYMYMYFYMVTRGYLPLGYLLILAFRHVQIVQPLQHFVCSVIMKVAFRCGFSTFMCNVYWYLQHFFPRASERRVLPIVGVRISSSQLHTFSSSHLLIFTPSHLHICSSSHLLIFATSHLHICSSSHLLIFTSSHLHIFSSSHLLLLPSWPLALLPSSSHLLILTSSHLHHIFTSSHLHIFSSCPLALLPSCPLALSFFSISLLKAGAGAVPTRRHETQPFRSPKTEVKLRFPSRPARPFRTKRGSIARNWGKSAISRCPAQRRNPFARSEVRSSKTEVKLRFAGVRRNPYARNEVRSSKTEVKVRVQVVPRNPFARNEVR